MLLVFNRLTAGLSEVRFGILLGFETHSKYTWHDHVDELKMIMKGWLHLDQRRIERNDDGPSKCRWVVTGGMAARIKNSVERFVVVGSLRLEHLLPGAFAWRPAPRARGGPVGKA